MKIRGFYIVVLALLHVPFCYYLIVNLGGAKPFSFYLYHKTELRLAISLIEVIVDLLQCYLYYKYHNFLKNRFTDDVLYIIVLGLLLFSLGNLIFVLISS